MTTEFKKYGDFKADEAILEFLLDGEFISEAKARTVKAKARILSESCKGDDEIINEAVEVYATSGHKGVENPPRVSWSQFYAIYTDPVNYRDKQDVLHALGYDVTKFAKKDAMKTTLNRLAAEFVRLGKPDLGSQGRRLENWGPNGAMREGGEDDEGFGRDDSDTGVPRASKDGINPGNRFRQTKTAKIFSDLNSENILPGELYADFTRIPKQNWNSFIKFWNRKRTSVAHDSSLFGREWKKVFVFGYQIDTNLWFEIWYNTLDSTFSVHDKHGNEHTKRAPTISESVRQLFQNILQVARHDVAYDRASFNKQVQMSITRATAKGMKSDPRMIDLLKKEHQRFKQEEDKQKDAEDRKKSQEEKSKSFKDTVNSAFDDYKKSAASSDDEAFDDDDNDPIEGEFIDGSSETEDREERMRRYERNLRRGIESKSPRQRPGSPTTDDVIIMGRDEDESTARNKAKQDELDKVFKAYKQERSRAEKDLEMRLPAIDLKASKEDKKETEVKPKTKQTKAPKKKGSIKSMFAGTKRPEIDDEDFSKYRRGMTDEERDEYEADIYGDDFRDFPDDEDIVDYLSGLNEAVQNLTLEEQIDISDNIADEIGKYTRESDYQRRVDAVRKDARSSSYTTGALKNAINSDLVTPYQQTKAQEQGKLRWLERRFLKGRPDIRTLPTDKPSVFQKAKSALLGSAYRADFIIGFSVGEMVDYEIWYVTEPNPEFNWYDIEVFGSKRTDVPRFVSSFYVYDITSERLIRKYIPYYRNAIQVVMMKIAPIA